jgi:hypothetical protein
MNKWQDPSLTLGERCVAFAEQEMKNGVKEDKPGSYTSSRIRDYFNICTRIFNGKETKIHFISGNWCSAAASFALHESLLPGETKPHGYRLGVVEVVSDLQHNGLYRTIAQARSGAYQLKIGDPIIFDRSVPSNPSTAWWRHIGRVYSIDSQGGFKCISGNSGGKYSISDHKLSQANILGFGEYGTVVPAQTTLPDWSHVNIVDLAPMEDTGKDLAVSNVFDLANPFG